MDIGARDFDFRKHAGFGGVLDGLVGTESYRASVILFIISFDL